MKYEDYVYQNFYRELNDFDVDCDEMKKLISDITQKEELFYVCEKVALIGINAPKMRVEGTTHVSACFQYKDIDIAVESVIAFICKYKIKNIDGLLDLIEKLHMFAVNNENSNKAHATIFNDSSSIRLGEFHTFSELPGDVWNEIKMYIKECIQDEKTPNSASSHLFVND